MSRRLIKRLVVEALASPALLRRRLDRLRRDRLLTILNFHRVAPDDRSAYAPLDPDLFDDVLGFVAGRFEVLTFADLEGWRPGERPGLIISFDDGYLDFAEHAMPRLARHGLRCNHNLIPSCVESGRPPLNVHVQDYVGRASAERLRAFTVPGFGPIDPAEDRVRLGQRLSNHLKNRPMAEQQKLAAELLPAIAADPDFRPTPMMGEAEWREAARTHEVGAHSFDHASLGFESDDYVRDDARRCREWIDGRLGLDPAIYAVPNGSVNERTADLIHAEGYTHVLLTGERHARANDRTPARFTMYGDSRAEVRLRACGWTAAA